MKLFRLKGLKSGSSGASEINTVPLLPLLTRSNPWSKNWPNRVNQEFYGAESPMSGATLGMNKELVTGLGIDPTPALATAAGLFKV